MSRAWQPRARRTRGAAPARPFAANCWAPSPLKFVICELNAHETRFIAPAARGIPKFPRAVELRGSFYGSVMKRMKSRQTALLTVFTALALLSCVLSRIGVGVRFLLLTRVTDLSDFLSFVLYTFRVLFSTISVLSKPHR